MLYEEAEGVLGRCKQAGYKNYILSNNFPELPEIIKKLGIAEYFNGYIVSANVGYEKPRIELFQHAMRIADNPQQCFMIGDNPIADVQDGKNAGMKTILVNNSSAGEADYRCEKLDEILKVLRLI